MSTIDREFYQGETLEIARNLIGCRLVHASGEGTASGIIVEVEAYKGPEDKASHSYKRRNPDGRTNIQYGPGGFAYIYLIYGMHYCMNVVTAAPGCPEAVLIRALEPDSGIELMKKRRGVQDIKKLAKGPGNLCKALGIDKNLYGADLCAGTLFIEPSDPALRRSILACERVNIGYAGEAARYPWRFLLEGSPYVSVPAAP